MTPRTATPPPRPSPVARYGPLTVVLVALALVAVVASTGRSGDDAVATEDPDVGSGSGSLPITWSEATEAGNVDDLDWGERCDPDTGRVTLPSVYAPPCVLPREGVEGGDTHQGVTDDTITVVLYEAADDDLAASLQGVSDPDDVQRETREAMVRLLEDRFETWGRTVEVEFLKGSGSDETSSRADAVRVASEIGAFASIGGPNQESAYAEELASRGVLCISCGLAMPDTAFQDNAPYLWGNSATPEQYLVNMGDYVIGRLHNRPAEFAGDPAMHTRDRVFASVNFDQDPPVFGGTAEMVEERGAERGYAAAERLTYQLVIPELPERARTIVARLKDAGVTTVIFLGDPIMPIYLTQAATDQDYFPEWVITGTVLTDTTVFGRQYDQTQWANAFGISGLAARLPQEQGDGYRLHEWFYGEAPAAANTIGVSYPPIQLFMLGVHMAGPALTPEAFRDGLFAYPPSGGTPVSPRVSFGDHGYHEATDYLGVDDMGEIYYDADATGLDEQGNEGSGMIRYVDGGRRYLPGEMPEEPPGAFRGEGSVTGYDEPPADVAPPTYPSPADDG